MLAIFGLIASGLLSPIASAQALHPNFAECTISPAGDLTCVPYNGAICSPPSPPSPYTRYCSGGGAPQVKCDKTTTGLAICSPNPVGNGAQCYTENGTAKCYARAIPTYLLQAPPSNVAFGSVVINTTLTLGPTFTAANLNPPDGYTISGFHVTGDFQITSTLGTCSGYSTYPNWCRVFVTAKPRLNGTRYGTLTMMTDRGNYHLPLTVVGAGFAIPTASDKNAGVSADLQPAGTTTGDLRDLLATAKSDSDDSCDETAAPPNSGGSGGGGETGRPPSSSGPLPTFGVTFPGSYLGGGVVGIGPVLRLPGSYLGGGVVEIGPVLRDPGGSWSWGPNKPKSFTGPAPVVSPGEVNAGSAGNLGAGNAAQEQADYSSTFANPLSFLRTYNSAGFGSTTSVRQHVGIGWRSNWDQSIVLGATGTTATMHRASGASYVYNYDGATGAWTTSGDVTGTLAWVKDANGYPYQWTYWHPTGVTERYDAIGRLISVVRMQGESYTLTYSPRGLLQSVQNDLWRQLYFRYDGEDRLWQLTDPAGGVTEYSYDSMSRLTQVKYPDLNTRQFRYENASFPFALTAAVDGTGTVHATYAYDSQGRIISRQLAGGVGTESMSYPSSARATFTDPHGATWTKDLTTVNGRVLLGSETVACTGCPTQPELLTYNSLGAVTSLTNRRGIQTTTGHGVRNLPAQVVEAVGYPEQRTTYTTWHPTLDLPAVITAAGKTVTHQYDGQGRVTQKSESGGELSRATSYTYNVRGQVTQINGPRTDVTDTTTYVYDGVGNLLTETNALGQSTQYSNFNGHGQPRQIQYPNGTVKTLSYDVRGRVLSESLAGITTTYTYDANGNLKTTTTNDGNVTTNLYDAAQRLYGIDNNQGEKVRHTLNNAGLITRTDTFDNLGVLVSTTRSAYDGLGRRTQHIDAEGRITGYSYDASGNVTSVTDPLNRTTATSYDPHNRPILVTDPLNGNARFAYDLADRLTAFTDTRGNATLYTFNALGDNTLLTSPDTGSTFYSFDSAGNTLTKRDARDQITTHTYDASGRLTRVAYTGGGQVTRTYDVAANGVGQLASVTDLAGTTSFTYDANGRLASKTQQVQGVTLQVAYTRDSLGRVTQIRYPSTNTLDIAYDSYGRPSQLLRNNSTIVLSSVQYFPFGAAESWLFGGVYESTRYIDLNNRVSGYRTPTGVRTLTYDAAGRITQAAGGGPGTQAFTYDALGRLTSFSGYTSGSPNESRAYTYDANGNRLTGTVNGTNYTYSYPTGSNRLTNVAGMYCCNSYDAAGNLLHDGWRTHSYDARGRLVQTVMPNPGGTTLTPYYNDRNQRVALWDSAANAGKVWLYDEEGRMLAEYTSPSGWRVHELMWLGSTPVAVAGTLFTNCGVGCTGLGLAYIWTDHLNTPRAITDQSGTKVWEWESAPFGDTYAIETSSRGTMNFNHRFPGQYFDAKTLLHQNVNRDYDPRTGRYVQSDPIGLKAGANTYTYTASNPISSSDPFGLDAYMCRRPLFGTPGANQRNGPDLPGNPLYHQYICVVIGSTALCGGQGTMGRWWGEGKPSDDSFHASACEKMDDRLCMDACLWKAIKNPRRPQYGAFGPGTNCQQWANDTYASCVSACKGEKP